MDRYIEKSADLVKDPYVLEFLELEGKADIQKAVWKYESSKICRHFF